MPASRVPGPALAAMAFSLLGCASPAAGPSEPTPTSGGASGGGGSLPGVGGGGSSSSSGGLPGCAEGPGYEQAGSPQWVAGLTAKIVDETGAPAAKVPVLVCGFGACSKPGTTSDDGVVCTPDEVSGACSPGMSPGLDITRPAFKYGLGIEHVKVAALLPSGIAQHDVGEVTTFGLPELALGVELAPGASAVSNGIKLTLSSGTVLEHDELVFDTPELQRFRAVEIPLAKAPPAVDPSAGFGILVGTTPVDTRLCPPGLLDVANTAGWAPGTEVEVWVHGVSVFEEWAPYGGWARVSGARVSADGQRVRTHQNEGVPILGLFGIKKG